MFSAHNLRLEDWRPEMTTPDPSDMTCDVCTKHLSDCAGHEPAIDFDPDAVQPRDYQREAWEAKHQFIINACAAAGYDIDLDEFDWCLAHEPLPVARLVEECAIWYAAQILHMHQVSAIETLGDGGTEDKLLLADNKAQLADLERNMQAIVQKVEVACVNLIRRMGRPSVTLVYLKPTCGACGSTDLEEHNYPSHGGTREGFTKCNACGQTSNGWADLTNIY